MTMPNGESKALALPEPIVSDQVALWERLARDPNVDVEKLERLIKMQKEILAENARAAFYAAFAAMQGEIPTISEKGEILVNGQVRSRYPRNEDIQEALRPILQRHGFALTFRNEFKDDVLTITGVLAHRGGHSERDEFLAKADTSGSKNAIQALGSTRSYGQRYTTMALLNIVSRDPRDQPDDDAHTSVPRSVEMPAGYDDWLIDMDAKADEGTAALRQAWKEATPNLRAAMPLTVRERLKQKAAQVPA
jgi:hypothetical protein